MVLEKPKVQAERITTEFIKGQRAAKRGGKYFNPYSKVTQSESYRQFEYGWKDQISKMYLDEEAVSSTEQKTKFPQLIILIVGIALAALCYYAFFN
jgi:hypothetical protein